MLVGGLPLLSPSPKCEAAIKPFLCLYLFGSCDADNQPHQVTQANCFRLRDEVCPQEWALATSFLGQGVLPECSSLLQQDTQCVNDSSSSVGQNNIIINLNDSTSTLEVMCAEGYYLNANNSLCRPLCTLWTDPPGVGLDSDNIAVLVSVIIALLASIAIFIVALTVQRSTMLTFPTLYLIYCCVTVTIVALLFLVGFMIRDKEKLFCSSRDLFDAFEDETIYCTIIGISFTYGLSQIGYWTAFHAVSLCWGIVHPFHFRRIKIEGKVKYVHTTTFFLGLLLPTIPALLHLKDGYTMTDTPTTLCTGRNQAVTYFALILPASGLIAVSSTALVIMFWKILKELVLKRLSSRPRVHMVGKVQVKILFIVFYYIIMGAVVLTIFTYFEVAGDADRRAVEGHFICQSTGLQPDKNCGNTPDIHLGVFNSLSGVAIILNGLLPVVILGFTVNCDSRRCCRKKWKRSST